MTRRVLSILGPVALLVLARSTVSGQPVSPSHIAITGSIDTVTNALEVGRVVRRLLPPGSHSAPGSGTFSIELRDGSGSVLFVRYFDLVRSSEPGTRWPFAEIMPFPEAAREIVVKRGDAVLGRIRASASTPAVTVVSPNGREVLNGTVEVTWNARDADGDALVFDLLASCDGGAHWRPVGLGLTRTSFAWNTALAPGGSRCLVEVLASDGVNTGSDRSDTFFSIADKLPEVTISLPAEGSSHPLGALIVFEGHAYDQEDGPLAEARLRWSSDRAGDLGTGATVATRELAGGTHVITLQATDSAGQTATRTLRIVVRQGEDTDSDGVDDGQDNCPAASNATQADVDRDGIGDRCDDSDGDGYVDSIDNCRLVANDQSDLNADGVGDVPDPSRCGNINRVPATGTDEYATAAGVPLSVEAPGVLRNDSDPDRDPLTVVSVDSTGAKGAFLVQADGALSYDPGDKFRYLAAGVTSIDSATYVVSDGRAGLGRATVAVTVTGENDPPVAKADVFDGREDTALVIGAPGVLGNDSDPDWDVLRITGVTPPATGNLDLEPDGSFTFRPAPNACGEQSFTYTLDDGHDRTATGTAVLRLVCVNDLIIGLSGDLAFGNVRAGRTATRTLTISNTGDSPLTVSGITHPAGFTGAWSGTIAAGGWRAVTVTFAPTAVTSYNGVITVNSDSTGGTSTISASGTGTAARLNPRDFDGDGRADAAVYRPSTGTWFSLDSSTGNTTYRSRGWGFEARGDTPAPGDYDGDGIVDPTVYRPGTGTWFILSSSSDYLAWRWFGWGTTGDALVPGDYDGDRTTDAAIYRPSTGQWFVLPSSTGFSSGWAPIVFGVPAQGDVPIAGDFDGDGKRDPAVYRPSTGTWFWLKSSLNFTQYESQGWGVQANGDTPAPGDYDGDGKTDPTVYRPKYGTWFVLKSSSNYTQYASYGWGALGDTLAPADCDGDGQTDVAIYRPATGEWFVRPSGGASPWSLVFGKAGDVPLVLR